MTSQNQPAGAGHQDPGYEKRDVNVRMLLAISGVLIVLLVFAVWATWQYYDITQDDMMRSEVIKPRLDSLRSARELERVPLYQARVDSETGVTIIPVDSAMKILAREAAKGDLR
jgi:hypothetical protein